MVEGLPFRVHGSRFGFGVWGWWFWVQGRKFSFFLDESGF